MEEQAYIGLGSNRGEGHKTLLRAWREVGEKEGITTMRLSSPYISAPVGMESSNWFTNCVGFLVTELSPHNLLHHLLQIEAEFGRVRDSKASGYQDRTLDLDIIYYGQVLLQDDELQLPHPRLDVRLFVLQPLAEIAPGLVDPADNMAVPQKLQRLRQMMMDKEIALQHISKSRWRE